MKQTKELNFEGQDIYCGLDVHKKSWSVCIRDEDTELKSFSQPAETAVLVNFLKRNYPGANYHAVYEAGFSGFWAQRQLSEQGVNCIITHAADVPTSDKEQQQKTDAVDCRKLAKSLSTNSLKGIYVPSEQAIEDRGILRIRHQLVKDQTRYKNRIMSLLNFYGVVIPEGYKQSSHFSKKFIVWLENLELSVVAKCGLQLQLSALKDIRKHLLDATRAVRELSKQERFKNNVALMQSIPGIGLINAMVILSELGDIKRFKTLDDLCSYVGLMPDIYASGDTRKIKGITRRCNHTLREALVESAWSARRLDPALLMAYKKYLVRMPANKAIIKITKKLLNRIRYILLHNVEYVPCVVG